MSEANIFYTIGAYATLIGIGYAIYHVSTQKDKKKGGVAITKTAKASQPEVRKEDRKKKQRLESFVTDQDSGKASKANAQKDKPAEAPQWLSNESDDKQKEIDNREFAKQLSKAKEGAKFNSKNDGPKQREKTVKQSKANKAKAAPAPAPPPAPEAVPSAPSSNGADADDDESPVVLSPETRPADIGGVSDMLEPAPAGPSVLRLTDTESKKDKKTKAAKNPEPAETKKQRQNRKKAEAAKAAREEAEKERKALEEKQRRTARIAEGRAAKDGSEFMAAVNGNKSVWTGTNGANGAAQKDDASIHAPLDTFEQPAQKKTAKKATPAAAPAAAPKEPVQNLESSWISALPSEEEQMEMLKDESDEWSTVKSKSSKKAKKAPSVESGEETPQARPAAQPMQTVDTNTNKSKPAAKNFGGSFSALTIKGDDAEDDVEEEWDV